MDAEYLEFKTSLYRTNARQTLSREVLTSDFFYSVGKKIGQFFVVEDFYPLPKFFFF